MKNRKETIPKVIIALVFIFMISIPVAIAGKLDYESMCKVYTCTVLSEDKIKTPKGNIYTVSSSWELESGDVVEIMFDLDNTNPHKVVSVSKYKEPETETTNIMAIYIGNCIYETSDGNLWEYSDGIERQIKKFYVVTISNNGTETVEDDMFISVSK